MFLCFRNLASIFFLLARFVRKTDSHILFRSMFSMFSMYLGTPKVAYMRGLSTTRFFLRTLASRGLEEPAHALRGLEEPFFQLCCCVSFWFWRELGFGCTYYQICTWSTMQLWCCVSFFGSGRKQFLVLRTYLVYNTVVRLCHYFFLWRERYLVYNIQLCCCVSFLVVAGNSSYQFNST